MTIQELREARNKAWEGAKAFVESKRDKDGLLSEEDAKTYAEMEKKVKDYSLEIERMEQMDALENEMRKPVNTPIVTKPVADKPKDGKTGRASDEYKEGMLKALRSILDRYRMSCRKALIQMAVTLCRKNMTRD